MPRWERHTWNVLRTLCLENAERPRWVYQAASLESADDGELTIPDAIALAAALWESPYSMTFNFEGAGSRELARSAVCGF